MVWITHPETGGTVEVLRDALPIYRQAGWDLLPDKEVKKAARQELADAAAAERAMTEAGLAALPPEQRPADTTDATQAEGKAE